MKIDTKIGLAGLIQVFASLLAFLGAIVLNSETVRLYRLWEIFPALLASSITIFGLKEIRKKT